MVELGEVGVDDRAAGGVQRDAAQDVTGRGAMDVAAVEDDVVGQLVDRRRRGAVRCEAEQHEVLHRAVQRRQGGGDLDPDQSVVVGAEVAEQRRHRVGADDPRHEPGVGRAHAGPRRRQARHRRGSDVDPARAGLVGKDEVAREAGAGGQLDDIAGLGGVERGLQVVTGVHGDDGAAHRRGVRGVQQHGRRGRKILGRRGERHRGGEDERREDD